MSSTGTTISSSSCFVVPASTISTSRSPPTKRATSSSGRCVADSAIRCTSRSQSTSSRSSVRARCEPRFVAATACTSSTITASTVRRISRAFGDVRIRNRLSGVVIRMSGGRRSIAWRSAAGVSPVRTATETSGRGRPSRSAAARMPASGAAQVALDVVVQGLQRRHVEQPHAALGGRRRGEPVEADEEGRERLAGARRRAAGARGGPTAIGGQPCACAAVGPSGKAPANHAAVAGERSSSTAVATGAVSPLPRRGCRPATGAPARAPAARRRSRRRGRRAPRRGPPEAAPARTGVAALRPRCASRRARRSACRGRRRSRRPRCRAG